MPVVNIGSRVVWGAAVVGDARSLIGESEMDDNEEDARSEREDAADWLREVLAEGPVSAKDVRRQADDAGHAWATVRRAKALLGVSAEKAAFSGGWRWSLPKVLTKAEDAHTICVDPLGVSEHLRDIDPVPVRCADCRNFIPDTVNPKAGLGACSAPGEQSKGLHFPFTLKLCWAFERRSP